MCSLKKGHYNFDFITTSEWQSNRESQQAGKIRRRQQLKGAHKPLRTTMGYLMWPQTLPWEVTSQPCPLATTGSLELRTIATLSYNSPKGSE